MIPGLFITATDTEIGKTAITCAIAAGLRQRGLRVGVCKPISAGCRWEREQWVNEDAEALAHFADCRRPLTTINPVRYREPLAPAVAAERTGRPVDWSAIDDSLTQLADASDVLLVEGIGGLMVPLDEKRTVLDLAGRIGYPMLVVARGNLGTLNHTAMTCRLVREAGLTLAGLAINFYHTDTNDIAEATNPAWLARQNHTRVLATVPETAGVAPQEGRLGGAVLDAVAMTDWQRVCGPANPIASNPAGELL